MELLVRANANRDMAACHLWFMVQGSRLMVMDQDTRWLNKYEEVVDFIEANHRNPSKHRIEEHDMLNWVKANRKALNAGKMKPERVEKFKELLALMEKYKRKNQYE